MFWNIFIYFYRETKPNRSKVLTILSLSSILSSFSLYPNDSSSISLSRPCQRLWLKVESWPDFSMLKLSFFFFFFLHPFFVHKSRVLMRFFSRFKTQRQDVFSTSSNSSLPSLLLKIICLPEYDFGHSLSFKVF